MAAAAIPIWASTCRRVHNGLIARPPPAQAPPTSRGWASGGGIPSRHDDPSVRAGLKIIIILRTSVVLESFSRSRVPQAFDAVADLEATRKSTKVRQEQLTTYAHG